MSFPTWPRSKFRRWMHRSSSTEEDEAVASPGPSTRGAQPQTFACVEPEVPQKTKPEAPSCLAPNDDGPNHEAMKERFRCLMRSLDKYESQYIDEKQLRECLIISNDMDFNTGRASGMFPDQFISPFPTDVIQQALKITKPWVFYDELEIEPYKSKEWNMKGLAREEASRNWRVIDHYLLFDEHALDGAMTRLTDWMEVELPKTRRIARFVYPKTDWRLEGLFRPCEDTVKRTRDPTRPHVTGFVCDAAPHRTDAFLTSELVCALVMAFATAVTERWAAHKYIPITLVSGSGRKMRVIQCILNSRDGKIEVRKTPVVDFKNGLLADQHETQFLTILGWMMGETMGDTSGQRFGGL